MYKNASLQNIQGVKPQTPSFENPIMMRSHEHVGLLTCALVAIYQKHCKPRTRTKDTEHRVAEIGLGTSVPEKNTNLDNKKLTQLKKCHILNYIFVDIETQYCYIAQAGLKLVILMPPFLKCWD